jgi:iduronate 2-sulfatase
MRAITFLARLSLCFLAWQPTLAAKRPNVILIVCDDLNDYIEGLDGHPQAQTPNMERLSKSGVCFTQAHCNIPICAPSRSSFLTGLYPHTSRNFGFDRWDQNGVLRNSRTLMDHFRANGYHTLGTGKLMHHLNRKEWMDYGNDADYGPFAFDGTERVAHPDVPSPFRDIGAIDGSFGPLVNVAGRTIADGKSYSWQTGNWRKMRSLRVDSAEDRDMTADELNGKWAADKLRELAGQSPERPFFMGVGFIRPHTPLIVPERFFKQFPLESIELPVIKPGDVQDTHARSVRGIVSGKEPNSERTEDMGSRLFTRLVASYDSQDEALRRFIQAYLACVASVDEQIGKILDVVENSRLKDETIIILTSDHGWGMGEKDYLYKNSLWQESTQVPLIVRVPGVARAGARVDHPVSLIDLYPTLIDLCGLTGETKKNDKGRPLDGHSLKPFLENPQTDRWSGPEEVLTALYKWAMYYDPAEQSYSLRSKDWRYIRYSNGKEELYHNAEDPYEWTNLASDPRYASRLEIFRAKLVARLPKPDAGPKKTAGEIWKDRFFEKHPQADTNQDGTLTWPEYRAYKAKLDARAATDANKRKAADAEAWKQQFFEWHPDADANSDGQLSWPEYHTYKAKLDARKAAQER